MRKALVLLAAIAVVAAPSAALAKKHHRAARAEVIVPVPAPEPWAPGWNFIWSGVDAVVFTPIRTVWVVTPPPPVVAKY